MISSTSTMTPHYYHKLIFRKQCGVILADVSLYRAVINGNIRLIKYYHEHHPDPDPKENDPTNMLTYAAKYGHLHVIQWFYKHTIVKCPNNNAIYLAARNGHLQVVKWLYRHRMARGAKWLLHTAAVYGHLEIVKWLRQNKIGRCAVFTTEEAARAGHLHILKWLHENNITGVRFIPHVMDCAASHGQLETVKWLYANRTEGCTLNAIIWAATYGHLETVKWLYKTNPDRWSNIIHLAMADATANGHLEIAEWLQHPI